MELLIFEQGVVESVLQRKDVFANKEICIL